MPHEHLVDSSTPLVVQVHVQLKVCQVCFIIIINPCHAE